jgi:hypothetical protein
MTALTTIDRFFTPPGKGEGGRPIRFCSRCGQPAQEPAGRFERLGQDRVCRLCGMGLMLTTSREALPGARAAFIVVTFELRVSAVSEWGEKVFGEEQAVLGSPVLDVVTSPLGDDLLVRSVGHAAQRACQPLVLPVRLVSEVAGEVGTMAARIATCGPPRAALVTVEPTDFGRR